MMTYASSSQSKRRDFITNHHSSSYDFISPLNLSLSGKKVLITGAAHTDGVGFATALAFARAGASAIALGDLQQTSGESITSLKAAAKDAGRAEPLIVSYVLDIADPSSVQAVRAQVAAAFDSHLDVLVNNAAFMEPARPFLELDAETEWRTWEVNIRGLLNMARAFVPLLLETRTQEQGLGTMINVASSGALSVRAGSASYRSSKLAMLRWTEHVQEELGPQGLLTYCVNPGAIRTNITAALPEATRAALPHQPDVAGDTIVWLTAGRYDWLGGRYVSCPWDIQELMARKEEIIEGDKLKMRLEM